MVTRRFGLLFCLKAKNYKDGNRMLVYMRITIKTIMMMPNGRNFPQTGV